MPTPGQELSSIDFASMIGGPLIAVVNAQAKAAASSVNFIKEVGFQKPEKKSKQGAQETMDPIYVTFKYPKETMPYQPATPAVAEIGNSSFPKGMKPHPHAAPDAPANDGTAGHEDGYPAYQAAKDAQAAQPAKYETMALQVPILTMLPIPYIRVEEVTIDFNAKIDSMEYMNIDASVDYTETEEISGSGGIEGLIQGSAKLTSSLSYKLSTSAGTNVERTYSLAIHVKAVQNELPAGMEKVLSILEKSISSFPVGNSPIKK